MVRDVACALLICLLGGCWLFLVTTPIAAEDVPVTPMSAATTSGKADVVDPTCITYSSAKIPKASLEAVSEVLKQRGLKLDGDTYSLIYQHNPEIIDLSQIKEGKWIILPMVCNGPDAQRLKALGIGATIDLEPMARTNSLAAMSKFADSYKGFLASADGEHTIDENVKSALGTLRSVDELRSDIEKNVQAKTVPLNESQLAYTKTEFEAASVCMDRVAGRVHLSNTLGPDEMNIIESVKKSLQWMQKMTCPQTNNGQDLQPKLRKRHMNFVVLRTSSSAPSQQVSGYKVSYTSDVNYVIQDTRGVKWTTDWPSPRAATDLENGGHYWFWPVKSDGTKAGKPVEREVGADDWLLTLPVFVD